MLLVIESYQIRVRGRERWVQRLLGYQIDRVPSLSGLKVYWINISLLFVCAKSESVRQRATPSARYVLQSPTTALYVKHLNFYSWLNISTRDKHFV